MNKISPSSARKMCGKFGDAHTVESGQGKFRLFGEGFLAFASIRVGGFVSVMVGIIALVATMDKRVAGENDCFRYN